MKKQINFILCLICIFICLPISVNAETLNELLAQAEANRAAYAEAQKEKELTEAERDEIIEERDEVQAEISSINEEIEQIEKDIEETEESIEKKDEEIKEIMRFVQISEGSSTYLEYIFGASSFTDFIYRVSVAEQLANYNDELIEEYNQEVKKLDQQQIELSDKRTELTQKEQELNVLEAKLNSEIEELEDGMLSKDEEYKTQITLINNMRKMGCGGDEEYSDCQARLSATAPNAYGTYMPIASGYLTSDYGQRTGEFHTGMDFATGVWGTPVYPVADGRVVAITQNASCGNNIIYILHSINGVAYTTSYWHLISVSVSVGQTVTYNTQIGTIAGTGYTESGGCANGGHVHLNLFRGLTTSNSGRINPRTIIPQAPSEGVYFSSR